MNAARPLYELAALARDRLATTARDGRVHPLQSSWYSLSRLLGYAPQDQPFYPELSTGTPSARPDLVLWLQAQPGGSLTMRWRSPSGLHFGKLILLRPPAEQLFDGASPAGATQPLYDHDDALFAELTAAVYRSLVARFDECFTLQHENWLVLHHSPPAILEVVGNDDFASEPTTAGAELEAYTGMRVSYIRAAFRRALFVFPVLRERLEAVSGRTLDTAQLRVVCQAYDAGQPVVDDRLMSTSNTAYLTSALDWLHQLQAQAEASPGRMAAVIGCPPQLAAQFVAQFRSSEHLG
jgi:hypothetical protein